MCSRALKQRPSPSIRLIQKPLALTYAGTQFVSFFSDFRMSKAISQVPTDVWLFMLFALHNHFHFHSSCMFVLYKPICIFMESERFEDGCPNIYIWNMSNRMYFRHQLQGLIYPVYLWLCFLFCIFIWKLVWF